MPFPSFCSHFSPRRDPLVCAQVAPLLHFYFPWLSRAFPGSSFPQILKRVIADQAVGAPCNILLTFSTLGLLRSDPGSILPRIQSQLLPTWQSSLSFWPFVHMLNFRFVPVAHQPLVAHTCSMLWGTILSYRANRAPSPKVDIADIK